MRRVARVAAVADGTSFESANVRQSDDFQQEYFSGDDVPWLRLTDAHSDLCGASERGRGQREM